ncbi:unnamed protein product, partial [Vitis vinifera]
MLLISGLSDVISTKKETHILLSLSCGLFHLCFKTLKNPNQLFPEIFQGSGVKARLVADKMSW